MEEINWDRIDKQKFFIQGIGMFSGVTTLLFPLSVVKTRQMASNDVPAGMQGMRQMVRTIWRHEGIPGFYRGFATVVFGTIPSRMMYLASLEMTKDGATKLGAALGLSPTTTAGVANFAGGAAASLSVQLVTVPIDVISQRQMVYGAEPAGPRPSGGPQQPPPAAAAHPSGVRPHAGHNGAVHGVTPAPLHAQGQAQGQGQTRGYTTACRANEPCRQTARQPVSLIPQLHRPAAVWAVVVPSRWHAGTLGVRHVSAEAITQRPGGVQIARMIVKEEGVRGLYRGLGMSVATFVPSSAVWWSAYGVYQQLVARAYRGACTLRGVNAPLSFSQSETMGVQLSSAVLAGATASLVTNPLDLIKTRVQVAIKAQNQATTVQAVLQQVLREEGLAGLLRGAAPRMVNSAMWGSAMVTVYEFLKRISVKQEGDP